MNSNGYRISVAMQNVDEELVDLVLDFCGVRSTSMRSTFSATGTIMSLSKIYKVMAHFCRSFRARLAKVWYALSCRSDQPTGQQRSHV